MAINFQNYLNDSTKANSTASLTEQQKVADKILSILEGLDPTCIVAGGAPRDWLHGKDAKDIDIFMHMREDLSQSRIINMIERLGLFVRPVPLGKVDEINYRTNPDIRIVIDVQYEDVPIQIIIVNKPTYSVVNSFAFNICKVWYKNKEIHTTPEYRYATANKVLIRTGDIFRSSEAYTSRIRAKFPNYAYYESKEKYLKALSDTI
jgi:hypothetical protein